MTDRVLGVGATGEGENGELTDPPEATVDEVAPEEAPVEPTDEQRLPPTAPPAETPAPIVAQ